MDSPRALMGEATPRPSKPSSDPSARNGIQHQLEHQAVFRHVLNQGGLADPMRASPHFGHRAGGSIVPAGIHS